MINAGRIEHSEAWHMKKDRSAGAHHVHAVVEDNLPQVLPAHYAEVFIISGRLLTEVCSGHLQTCQLYHGLCSIFMLSAYTKGSTIAL